MKKQLLFVLFLGQFFSLSAQNTSWKGYKMDTFNILGKQGKIVYPKQANEARNWIWRARFWGHEPQVDLALLNKGFHLVYIDVSNLFGNKEAVKIWNTTYNYLITKHHLNKKVVLEGLSRGGLIVYNWTVQNLDKVACIYADAPVCDIKSWPGGLGKSEGAKNEWITCLKAYDLNEKNVKQFQGNPINHAKKIANAGIPILHVCGKEDKIVPMAENTLLLKENYEASGGTMELIVKEGVGHHPHSLENPTPIVNFIITNI